MRVAPEGWPFILLGWALVALGAWGVQLWGRWMWAGEAPLVLIAVWLLVFFRDPVRTGARGDRYVIAPADGKVVDVRVVAEPMFLHFDHREAANEDEAAAPMGWIVENRFLRAALLRRLAACPHVELVAKFRR